MKKRRMILTALMCSVGIMCGSLGVKADAVRVVTLGADLTDQQKQMMLNYFNTNDQQSQIMTVTNADEKARLSKYVPAEQIGSRTVSCAYVLPTTSGGIQVKTANLNYVTPNMIASSLSTSGVTNCQVIAACPFEVSGTGALTGVLMAYEQASGQTLDETKKDIATEEMVTTGNLAQSVGQDQASQIINQSKLDVIENDTTDDDEIGEIIENNADAVGATVTQDDIKQITELLKKIAEQQYDIDQMKTTLENINKQVSKKDDNGSDNIIDDINNGALGEPTPTPRPAYEEPTETPAAPTETPAEPTETPSDTGLVEDDLGNTDSNNGDSSSDSTEGSSDSSSSDDSSSIPSIELKPDIDTSKLTEDQLKVFEKFDTIIKKAIEDSMKENTDLIKSEDAVEFGNSVEELVFNALTGEVTTDTSITGNSIVDAIIDNIASCGITVTTDDEIKVADISEGIYENICNEICTEYMVTAPTNYKDIFGLYTDDTNTNAEQ
jgi:uncharacterized protein YpuA (DUF1002 family)